MKNSKSIITVLLCTLCLAGGVTAAETDTTDMATQQEPCCFENPRFSGTCEVTPGPEESCGSILGYLNNPNSVGKDYCDNTNVRGGWTQASCEESASTTAAETSGGTGE